MKNLLFACCICLPLLFLLMACKTSNSNAVKSKNGKGDVILIRAHTPLVSMTKGPCHGTCPIYTMTVFNDGVINFDGKRFCDKLGPHTTTLSDTELTFLQQKIDLLDTDSYPEKIQSNIPDFPSIKLTFSEKGKDDTSVWWRNGAPNELNELSVMLDKFRTNLTWKVDADAPLPPGTIENQMLVHLKKEVIASDFSKQYRDHNLVPIREVSPGQNYWLFEFDTKKISGVEMLNILSKSEQVQNAEFNRKLEVRE